MQRRTYLATVGSTVTALSVGLAGCGEGGEGADTDANGDGGTDGDGDGATDGNGDGATDGSETNVDMVTEGEDTYYFDPIGLFVESGETVTFTNEAGSHSATAYHEDNDAANATRVPDDAESWNSGVLSEEGSTFEHTFETAGTHDYFCIPHKALGMVGRIVVDEAGGPGAEGQPPDGDLPSSDTIVDDGSVSYDGFAG